MTKNTLGIITLSASLFAAGALLAQSSATKAAPAAEAPKQQKLIKVSTLTTIKDVQEFQNNVQVMQAERQQAIEATAAYEKETNAAKKKELKTKLDQVMAKLNDDNQKMIKAYGFSLERNYTLVTEVAHVFMFVSDEEAAKFEKEQAAAAAAALAKEKAGPVKK